MMKQVLSGLILIWGLGASGQTGIVVLGIAQDGGFPHIGCQEYCQLAWEDPDLRKFVVSLGIVDKTAGKWWLLEATPDIIHQLELFRDLTDQKLPYLPEGIFLTHAHIGHYTGLMQLGREALGASDVPVYAMPLMSRFLKENGPWSQLVQLQNIEIRELENEENVVLSDSINITPYQVPHRDEFSETVGYLVDLSGRRSLFIPDIDKWQKWEHNIVDMVANSRRAFIDGSFLRDGELKNRNVSEIPHPFVSETMGLFEDEPDSVKAKIFFIHFNHTNPLLWDPGERVDVISAGYNIAIQGRMYD